MDAETLLIDVLSVVSRLEVDVRQERLGGSGGGWCRVRGREVLFVDLDADVATRADRCLEAMYLPPALREKVDALRPPPG